MSIVEHSGLGLGPRARATATATARFNLKHPLRTRDVGRRPWTTLRGDAEERLVLKELSD